MLLILLLAGYYITVISRPRQAHALPCIWYRGERLIGHFSVIMYSVIVLFKAYIILTHWSTKSHPSLLCTNTAEIKVFLRPFNVYSILAVLSEY